MSVRLITFGMVVRKGRRGRHHQQPYYQPKLQPTQSRPRQHAFPHENRLIITYEIRDENGCLLETRQRTLATVLACLRHAPRIKSHARSVGRTLRPSNIFPGMRNIGTASDGQEGLRRKQNCFFYLTLSRQHARKMKSRRRFLSVTGRR